MLATQVGAFITHVMFMMGTISWAWGLTNLGLAMGIDQALVKMAAFAAFYGIVVYMFMANTSMNGVPDFPGVPADARVLFGVPTIALVLNLILKAKEGDVTPAAWGLIAAGFLVPQLCGAKMRSKDWKVPLTN